MRDRIPKQGLSDLPVNLRAKVYNYMRRAYWRYLRAVGHEELSWNLQFQSGRWGAEVRSREITERVQLLCNGGRLVEFGCGFGDLPRSLPTGTFSSYLGIDISSYAISVAQEKIKAQNLHHCTFQAMDMARWQGDKDITLIVIEECLMYLKGQELVEFLHRCCESLAKEGSILVTVFSAKKHYDTIEACRHTCQVQKEELVGTRTFLVLKRPA
ncbi:MAG: class I SAM-dependent methyltransferase [Candidatus Hydrogenedentes bacterium]|nr:class I SAM-dependent methyltransferase [Candidatus Hydrogenedentota bacterium]